MADTTFVDRQTPIMASWLNDINNSVYKTYTEVNVLNYIPPAEWPNILAGTPTLDVKDYVQAAIDTKRPLYAPGVYKIVGSLNFNNLVKLRGDGYNGGASAGSCFVFYNTGTSPAVVRTASGAARVNASIEDMAFKASSWDVTTGANGHGLDTSAHLSQTRVQWIGFKKLGCYYHHDASGNGPYESVLTNVRALYSGQHGIVIGRGANVITLINCEAKWNGAPAYLTAPSTTDSYDGVLIDNYDDGSGWPAYTPEGVRVIGGDASYNSRYGWNFQAASYCNLAPGYAEFNKDTYDINLGNDLKNNFIVVGRIPATKVNMAASFYKATEPNSIFIGGRDYGSGNTNTGPQDDYSLANLRLFLSVDPTLAKSVLAIPNPTTGDMSLGAYGGATMTLGSGAAVDLPLLGNVKFSGVNTTGAGSALLGSNCPATTLSAPYTWVRVKTADDSIGFLPIWK